MTTPAKLWAGLPAKARNDLTTRSNRAGLVHLSKHAALIAVLSTYVALGGPLWWAAMLPLGLTLVFLFTLQHECTHQTPFRSKWINEVVGQICGVLLVQPLGHFRAFHMAHHRHTNDPAKDPELQGDAKPKTWAQFAWHLGTISYWQGKVAVLANNAVGRFDDSYVGPRASARLKIEARLYVALYTIIFLISALISPILLWVWLIPIALGFPILRLYLLAEHSRCPQVENMFLNSRTTLTHKAVHLLAWNMPYHAEHHAFPAVPFHQLPKVHTATQAHLGTVTEGYTTFTLEFVKEF